MKLATQYNFKDRPMDFRTYNHEETMTQQADANELDINVIMKRYTQTGQLPRINSAQPQYGDFSEVGDYRACLDKVTKAREDFNALPSHVRKRFANDPAQFVEFASDPENAEELKKLGLTKPQEEPYSKDTAAIIKAVEKSKENDDGRETNTTDTTGHRNEQHRPGRKGRS